MGFLATGSTRKQYTGVQARTVMLKLIGTHVLDMMKEDVHISIVAIRRLFNFIRLFLYFMKNDAQIEKDMDVLLDAFIKDPASRHKNTCKNMLDYQIMSVMCACAKFNREDFLKSYCEEQLDR